MAGHTSKSPSKFGRYVVCPGAVEAEADFPDQTSPYADEGTAAHAVIERTGRLIYEGFGLTTARAADFLGQTINVARDGEEPRLVTVNQEMVDGAQVMLDYIARRKEEMETAPFREGLARSERVPVMVFFEERVSPAWALGTTDCDGTADVILLSDYEVEVVDYKHGKGVPVPVIHEDGFGPQPLPPLDSVPRTDPTILEEQFMLYLVGVLGRYPLRVNQTGRITVVQPRAAHHQGPIRSFRVGEPEISGFIKHAKAKLELMVPGALRVASSRGCRFCTAKPACRTYAVFSSMAVGAPTGFDKDTFLAEVTTFATRSPDTLAPAEIVRILEGADLLRGLLKAVEEHAHAQMVKGAAPAELSSAFKLVHGRSLRKWSAENDESIAAALTKIRWKDPVSEKTTGLGRKHIFEEKLKSPAQIETALKQLSKGANLTATHWEAFNRLVTKPEGALQLVPISDSRPPASPKDPATMFGDLPVHPAVPAVPAVPAAQETPAPASAPAQPTITPEPAAFDAMALFTF